MSQLSDFRAAKDHSMVHDHHSPFTDDQKRRFHGLSYYDENPDVGFVLDLERHKDEETVEMQTSTGEITWFVRWGNISFEVEGLAAQLTVYKDPDSGEFFLQFADATSGVETYGAGRYLEPEALPDGRMSVDFNYAYNPYCAYNERWSCSITPAENRIVVPIRAGERIFS